MIDFPLILNPAGGRGGGADGVENDRWSWREGGYQPAPFLNVGFFDGLEIGVAIGRGGGGGMDWRKASGDGFDGCECVGGEEEGGEDLRADGSGAAEY